MMKLQISIGRETASFVPVINNNVAAVRNANHRCAEPMFIGASTENPKMRIKTTKIKRFAIACSLAALCTINTFAVQPLGTGITYQGRLMDGGAPANGTYDLGFVLHDDPVNLTYIGNSIIIPAVPVTNGLFTVQLNGNGEFGPTAFNGQARWLEVDVRTNNNLLLNNFTVLSPRQLLAPTPHAMFAMNASNAMNASFAANVADGSISSSKLAPGAVAWSSITGIPAGFADGVDNDTTYAAGTGLTLSGANNQFSVNFAGNGGANTASRSDHNHFGAAWGGSTQFGRGVSVTNGAANGAGLYGQQGNGSGFPYVFGNAAGVWGEANQGSGVYGASATFRGVQGVSLGSQGTGVYGTALATNGTSSGVYGESASPDGVGVLAKGSGSSGTALRVSNGAIRVTGAGVNTATPAFAHVVTASNTVTNGYYSVINNPYCNNDPDALLFVVPVEAIGTNFFFSPVVNIFYDRGDFQIATNRWVLDAGAGPFYFGERYNVLVLKP